MLYYTGKIARMHEVKSKDGVSVVMNSVKLGDKVELLFSQRPPIPCGKMSVSKL